MQFHMAICDDEKIIREDIYNKIMDIHSDCKIDVYHASSELLENPSQYDMIFLDIEMPGMNGVDVSYILREKGYKGFIVFLTSHAEYMKEAFRVKAFRFLSKPADYNELKEAIHEAEKEILKNKQMVVADYGAEFMINLSDIYYIKSNKNKTIVRLKDNTLEVNKTLKQWLDELGTTEFYQIHKSYVVAFRHIKKIEPDVIILADLDEEIPIARRSMTKVKKAFYSYIRENARWM